MIFEIWLLEDSKNAFFNPQYKFGFLNISESENHQFQFLILKNQNWWTTGFNYFKKAQKIDNFYKWVNKELMIVWAINFCVCEKLWL
jgi:hypothetical protein